MASFCTTATSNAPDARRAVEEVAARIDAADVLLVLATVDYDLEALSTALSSRFSVPIVGCTTAGNVGAEGYCRNGLQVIAFREPQISVQVHPIAPLGACQAIVSDLAERIGPTAASEDRNRFALLLVDGLSHLEERLAATLHHCLPQIPFIGGSAGDDLSFTSTQVLVEGRWQSDAAALVVFETDLPFAAFKLQHFHAREDALLVVTRAHAATRTVFEFNGEPAAAVYAEHAGLDVDQLTPHVFSRHPVVLRVGEDCYVRSIQRCNDDQSLTFYCAMEEGVVLRPGRAVHPVEALELALDDARRRVGNPALILGCDCILRRLEFEEIGLLDEVGTVLAAHGVAGFSTYGEQFNALHMNQTFTGLAIGEPR